MADKIPEGLTAYSIPLTDKELMTLGRITAAWAQVDFLTDRLLMLTMDFTPEDFKAQFGDKMSGARIAALDLAKETLPPGPARAGLLAFVKAANAVKGDRNHAVHGIWGKRMAKNHDFVAARFARAPGKPLKAQRLNKLFNDIALASVLGMKAVSEITGQAFGLPANFYFGSPATAPARLAGSRIPIVLGRPSQRQT